MLVGCVPLDAGLGTLGLVFTDAMQNAVTTADPSQVTSLYYSARLVGEAALGGVLNLALPGGGPHIRTALRTLWGPPDMPPYQRKCGPNCCRRSPMPDKGSSFVA